MTTATYMRRQKYTRRATSVVENVNWGDMLYRTTFSFAGGLYGLLAVIYIIAGGWNIAFGILFGLLSASFFMFAYKGLDF